MEHKTDGLAAHAECANLLVLQLLQEELGTEWLVELEKHDIRLDGENHRDVGKRAQPRFPRPCFSGILPPAPHLVLEGGQPRRGPRTRPPPRVGRAAWRGR